MTEITFIVKDDQAEGGYTAHAHWSEGNRDLFTEGDTREELVRHIREAVDAAFPQREQKPQFIRLQFVHDETTIPVTDNGPNGHTDRYPLRGSVLKYLDPLDPACPSDEWEAMQ